MVIGKELFDWAVANFSSANLEESDLRGVDIATAIKMRNAVLSEAKTDADFAMFTTIVSLEAHLNQSSMVMPDKLNAYYRDKVLDSAPGDMVVFQNDQERVDLINLFFPPTWNGGGAPIDILKEGTIPLMDMRIRIPDEDELNSDIRVVIFPDYQERLEDNKRNFSVIGAYLVYPRDRKLLKKRVFMGLLSVIPESNFIVDSGLIGWIGEKPENHTQLLLSFIGPFDFHTMISPYIMAWYCVQLTLLNPPTREVYHTLREKAPSVKTFSGKRNKVKYVKKIWLNAKENLTPKESRTGGKHKMKCPYWRVIGHWRQYKNGNRIFIKGYWKGPNRLFIPKGCEDGMRERVLAFNDDDKGDENHG